MPALSPIRFAPPARAPARTGSALAAMLDAIADAAREPLAWRHHAMAEAIAAHVTDPGLLGGHDCPCCPDRYIRHLLHADPEGGYAVVALVWRPGQMSPVHAHRTWCALGVHRGTLTESFYALRQAAGAPPTPTAARICRAGEGSHGPADHTLIHRIANLGTEDAVSIHAYGAAFDRFGTDVNLVYAD